MRSASCSRRPNSVATWARSGPTARGSRPSVTATYSPTTTWSGRTRRCIPGWDGPYDIDTTFHEPFVLFGFLAAITSLELVTGIIILPQRQTALRGQAGGRGRPADRRAVSASASASAGTGWSTRPWARTSRPGPAPGGADRPPAAAVDRAVGDATRAASTTSPGRAWRRCRCSGRSRSGSAAQSPAAYRRVGRLADGWFPQVSPGPELDEALPVIAEAATARPGATRPPSSMEGRVTWARRRRLARRSRSATGARPGPPTCPSTP